MFNIKMDRARKGIRTGFYSEKEFKEYQARLKPQEAMNVMKDTGIEVVSQSSESNAEDKNVSKKKEKRVQWPDSLEW